MLNTFNNLYLRKYKKNNNINRYKVAVPIFIFKLNLLYFCKLFISQLITFNGI